MSSPELPQQSELTAAQLERMATDWLNGQDPEYQQDLGDALKSVLDVFAKASTVNSDPDATAEERAAVAAEVRDARTQAEEVAALDKKTLPTGLTTGALLTALVTIKAGQRSEATGADRSAPTTPPPAPTTPKPEPPETPPTPAREPVRPPTATRPTANPDDPDYSQKYWDALTRGRNMSDRRFNKLVGELGGLPPEQQLSVLTEKYGDPNRARGIFDAIQARGGIPNTAASAPARESVAPPVSPHVLDFRTAVQEHRDRFPGYTTEIDLDLSALSNTDLQQLNFYDVTDVSEASILAADKATVKQLPPEARKEWKARQASLKEHYEGLRPEHLLAEDLSALAHKSPAVINLLPKATRDILTAMVDGKELPKGPHFSQAHNQGEYAIGYAAVTGKSKSERKRLLQDLAEQPTDEDKDAYLAKEFGSGEGRWLGIIDALDEIEREAASKVGVMDRLRTVKDSLLGGANLGMGSAIIGLAEGSKKLGDKASEKFSEPDPDNPGKRRLTRRGKMLLVGAGAVAAVVAMVTHLNGDSPKGGGLLADAIPDFNDTYPHSGVPVPADSLPGSAPNHGDFNDLYPHNGEVGIPDTTTHPDINDVYPKADAAPTPASPDTTQQPSTPDTPKPAEPTQPQPGTPAPGPDSTPAPATPDTAKPALPDRVTVEAEDTVYGRGHQHGMTDTQIANGINDGSIKVYDRNGNVVNPNRIQPGYTIDFNANAAPVEPPAPAAVNPPNPNAPLDPNATTPPADAVVLRPNGGTLTESVQDWLTQNGRGGTNLHDAVQAWMNYNQSLGVNLNWDTARQLNTANVGGTSVATLNRIPVHTPPQFIFDETMRQLARAKELAETTS